MSYAGLVCLATCSLGAVMLGAILPFITAGPRESDRRQLPLWLMLTAFGWLTASILLLRERAVREPQLWQGMLATVILLAGIFSKWIIDIAARKPIALHERTLAKSLLVAPLAPLLWSTAFNSYPAPRFLLLWFVTGFFWQTVFGDLERLVEKERVIVRRREPPLPPPATLKSVH
jgi:hypothetical protein